MARKDVSGPQSPIVQPETQSAGASDTLAEGGATEALTDHSLANSYDRIGAYLREYAPLAASMSEAQLREFIVRQEPIAANYAVITERELGRWCWLGLMMGEDFHQGAEANAALTAPLIGGVPSRLDLLFEALAAALEQQDESIGAEGAGTR
jgi:hypothetical protein